MDVKTLEQLASKATSTPESAISYLINCLYVYQQGDDGALGYMGYVLSKKECSVDKTVPSGLKPTQANMYYIKRLRDKGCQHSIIALVGGTWQKDYKDVKPDTYKLPVVKEDDNTEGHRVFLRSGGRDNPFPVTVKQSNEGQWKVVGGLGTICMDVRKPKSDAGDI